jgi:hypothetical protein
MEEDMAAITASTTEERTNVVSGGRILMRSCDPIGSGDGGSRSSLQLMFSNTNRWDQTPPNSTVALGVGRHPMPPLPLTF